MKNESLIKSVGKIAFIIAVIAILFLILFSQLKPMPKIAIAAIFIFLVCALLETAVVKKKAMDEFNARPKPGEKPSKFRERLERIKKEQES